MIAALRSSSENSSVWVIMALGLFWWSFLIPVESFLVLEMMGNFSLYPGHFRLWDSGFYLSHLLQHANNPLKFRIRVCGLWLKQRSHFKSLWSTALPADLRAQQRLAWELGGVQVCRLVLFWFCLAPRRSGSEVCPETSHADLKPGSTRSSRCIILARCLAGRVGDLPPRCPWCRPGRNSGPRPPGRCVPPQRWQRAGEVCVRTHVCVRAPPRAWGPGRGVWVRAQGPGCGCGWVCDGCPSLAQGRGGSCTTAHLPGGPSADQGAAVPASGACPRRAGKVAGFEPSGPLVKRLRFYGTASSFFFLNTSLPAFI